MKKTKNIILCLLGVFLLIFSACAPTNDQPVACTMDAKMCPDGSYVGRTAPNCEFEACPISDSRSNSLDELKKFDSTEDLKAYLKQKTLGTSDSSFGRGVLENAISLSADFSEGLIASKSSTQSSGTANEYSQTNVQVKGVDEADIVKNDDKYIYTLSKNRLIIVDAFPVENAEILSEIKIEGMAQEIFINENNVAIFTTDYDEHEKINKYDFVPMPSYEQITKVLVYDTKNKKKPVLVNEFSVSGYYSDSRMIGDTVYLISQEQTYYYSEMPIPLLRTNNGIINPEIYYFDNPETNFNFHTIASFNILDEDKEINAKTFMLGYSNSLYVSENNIYIGYQKNRYWNHIDERKEQFFEVILPELPKDIQTKINNLGQNPNWDNIAEILEDMYNSMSEDEKEKLIKNIEDSVEKWNIEKQEERSKTIIHKINIDEGEIEYDSKGVVKGSLLNQFSFDEYEENLRVATTFDAWTSEGSIQYNNVYVLDKNMKTIGSLEKIAKDERIYSTRFMRDKLYMVTFKQVDPLFVIDLSEVTSPKILGYLKIPGFSDYLHPYDESHLIGIGKDTIEENGRVRTKGIKMSMFDVSDFENPKETDTVIIGDSGSYSLVSQDHKALLFDREKNLIVVPVYEVEEKYEFDDEGYFKNNVFLGSYVFNVDEKGFDEKGRITHNENNDDRYYWNSPFMIKRALYLDDILYTISEATIKANNLGDLKELKVIDLKYENTNEVSPYFGEGIPVDIVR